MKRKKEGFTLVELMMVMGIIALIIALGVPIYSAMAMSRSLGGSAELIHGSFLKYRAKASASSRPVFLVFEHWHMDSTNLDEEDWDKLRPPKIQAFVVEPNEEVQDDWDVLEIDDPINLPKGTWFNKYWIEQLLTSASIPQGTPYKKQAEAIIGNSYYNMSGQQGWASKLYMIIFMPNGHLEIVGRENIAGYLIEDDENPDADIWMTNGDDTMLIDINPSTGRTNSVRYENSKYEKFQD